jgi:hypothetical protein
MFSGRNVRLLGSSCSNYMVALIGGRCVYASVLRGAPRFTGGYGRPQNVGWDSDKCTRILLKCSECLFFIGGRSLMRVFL